MNDDIPSTFHFHTLVKRVLQVVKEPFPQKWLVQIFWNKKMCLYHLFIRFSFYFLFSINSFFCLKFDYILINLLLNSAQFHPSLLLIHCTSIFVFSFGFFSVFNQLLSHYIFTTSILSLWKWLNHYFQILNITPRIHENFQNILEKFLKLFLEIAQILNYCQVGR